MVRNFIFIGALALSTGAIAQEQAPPAPADATTQAAQPAAKADVAAVVAAEFSKWLIALKTQSDAGKATQNAADLDKWAGAAFAQADADKSSKVTQGELTTFLQG